MRTTTNIHKNIFIYYYILLLYWHNNIEKFKCNASISKLTTPCDINGVQQRLPFPCSYILIQLIGHELTINQHFIYNKFSE